MLFPILRNSTLSIKNVTLFSPFWTENFPKWTKLKFSVKAKPNMLFRVKKRIETFKIYSPNIQKKEKSPIKLRFWEWTGNRRKRRRIILIFFFLLLQNDKIYYTLSASKMSLQVFLSYKRVTVPQKTAF